MKKRIGIAFVVLLLSAIGYWMFLGGMERTLSKILLTDALSDTLAQLYERFQTNPLNLLNLLHGQEKGKYTADIDLLTPEGDQKYHIVIEADSIMHQFSGHLTTEMHPSGLKLYADQHILAFGDDSNYQNCIWGIRYNTFKEDISHFPLIDQLIPPEDLAQLQTFLDKISKAIKTEYIVPDWLHLKQSEIEKVLVGIIAVPCQVETRAITQDSTCYKCTAFSYTITNALLQEAISLGLLPKKTEALNVEFYLHKKTLLKTVIHVSSADILQEIVIDFPINIAKNQINIDISAKNGTKSSKTSVQIEAKETQGTSEEHYSIQHYCADGIQETYTLSYHRNSEEGSWEIRYNHQEDIILVQVKEYNGMVQIKTCDLSAILNNYTNIIPNSADLICVANIHPGAAINKPEYKTPENWDMEDIWSIIICLSDWFWTA